MLGSECATASEIILSSAECEQALQELGTPVASIVPTGWSGSDGGVPAGCSYRPGPDKCGHVSCLNSPNQVHFNSASSGNGRADLQPICKQATTTTTTTADPNAPYYMGKLGSECVTAEEIILSAAECEQALQQLGTPVSSISPTGWSGSDGGVPAGCSYRPGPDKC